MLRDQLINAKIYIDFQIELITIWINFCFCLQSIPIPIFSTTTITMQQV